MAVRITPTRKSITGKQSRKIQMGETHILVWLTYIFIGGKPTKRFVTPKKALTLARKRLHHITSLVRRSFGKETMFGPPRSEEHTSELQSLRHLVCRLL